VGAVFAFIPIIGVIAWPLVIIGLIFGVLGIQRARRGESTNRGTAIAGTALSAVGLFICVLWTIVVLPAAREGYTEGTSSEPMSAPPVVTSSTANTPRIIATPAPSPTGAVETRAPSPTGTIGEGTYIVGVDIEPGTYRSTGAKKGLFEFCSWRTLAGPSDNSDIIDIGSANADEPMVVEIGPEVKAFKSSNCEPWQRVG